MEVQLAGIIQNEHIKFRMAKNDSVTIRVKKVFIEDILNKIIELEKKRGLEDVSFANASLVLRNRIMNAGGIK